MPPVRSRLAFAAALVALALAVAVATIGGAKPGAEAQELEAQALQIERRLLCPQCTSKRLDVCDLPICDDMRALIRERLAAGEGPDEIVGFFSDRYGQRVLADLPKSGFNLVLFCWVGASIALVALIGSVVLLRLRRSAVARSGPPLGEAEERWLDDQLRAQEGGR